MPENSRPAPSGRPKDLGRPDQNQSQRFAVPADGGEFDIAIRVGPLAAPARNGAAAQMQWKSLAIRLMNPIAGLMAGNDAAPPLIQCRPPHLNFNFNPGIDCRAQGLKGRIIVGKR